MAKKSKQYDYDLSEVKRLIGETDKNYREISAETGCPYASVVYHGRKIRGRVNRSHQVEDVEYRSTVAAPFEGVTEDLNKEEKPAGTTLSISRNDVPIHEAEKEVARMIKAAQAMGLSKINLTIEK
ncbi:hypothetical protein EQV77_08855 [Halobacillus fulvus]|nr:hypothetical protein EQV77_08855 [Halobacillus fulvus]